MQLRQNALKEWLQTLMNSNNFFLKPLAGDASFRRYFRLYHQNKTYVLMDAPPEKEDIISYITIGQALSDIGVHTPHIHAINQMHGFLLLEDLGDQLLLSTLNETNANELYKMALSTLIQIQQCSSLKQALPSFNEESMQKELDLFRLWFIEAYCELSLTQKEEDRLKYVFEWLISMIATQPQTVIHRDYHSRNLMVIENLQSRHLAVIDHQDAMVGPVTYDLVSLLKDCYIQWSNQQVMTWLKEFYALIPDYDGPFSAFLKSFELCGIQRHLKVLGIFCRLHIRDHKSGYLNNLPLTFHYLLSALPNHPELTEFSAWMRSKIQTSFIRKQEQCKQP